MSRVRPRQLGPIIIVVLRSVYGSRPVGCEGCLLASPPGWRSSSVSDETRSLMRRAEVIDLTSDDTAGGPASANYSRPYVTFASCSGIPATVNAPIKGKTLKPALVQRSSVSMLASDFDGIPGSFFVAVMRHRSRRAEQRKLRRSRTQIPKRKGEEGLERMQLALSLRSLAFLARWHYGEYTNWHGNPSPVAYRSISGHSAHAIQLLILFSIWSA